MKNILMVVKFFHSAIYFYFCIQHYEKQKIIISKITKGLILYALAIVNLYMKILLLGEYSNVHWTLAQGLRALGHHVTVVSDGDVWKNYPRDISLKRKSINTIGGIKYLVDLWRILPKLTGYDVVQIINPMFLSLKAERHYFYYHFLRRHNNSLFMGAFGMDYYWVCTGLDGHTFRYSDFNIGTSIRKNKDNDAFISEWLKGEPGRLNRYIAKDCDGIITGLYEYDACYRPIFPEKTCFIPFPINIDEVHVTAPTYTGGKIRFFIGIQQSRDAYKGTDIMYRALIKLADKYPDRMEIVKAISVPYNTYCHMLNSSHILLDQLYSYTPAMNGLLAMAKGLVLVGGGEPENYMILNENQLHPIINVLPSENDVYNKLEKLLTSPDQIPILSAQSREYILRHHDYKKVAQKYIDFWTTSQNKHI